MQSTTRLLIALVAYGVSIFPAVAQEKRPVIDPPELVTMREEHLRSMQQAAVPVLTAYTRQLDAQKFKFTQQGNLEAVQAVEDELKGITKQLEDAKTAAGRTGATLQLTILSASYGSPDKKQVVDITRNLRDALRSGTPTIKLDSDKGAAGIDPAPYKPKQTTVTYAINGERKQKTFGEGHELNFKDDLR